MVLSGKVPLHKLKKKMLCTEPSISKIEVEDPLATPAKYGRMIPDLNKVKMFKEGKEGSKRFISISKLDFLAKKIGLKSPLVEEIKSKEQKLMRITKYREEIIESKRKKANKGSHNKLFIDRGTQQNPDSKVNMKTVLSKVYANKKESRSQILLSHQSQNIFTQRGITRLRKMEKGEIQEVLLDNAL